MRSAYPPERLEVELQSRLGPTLSGKGYRVVGQGTAGVTWRRELSGRATIGLVALGFMALGGLADAQVVSILFGIMALAAAGGIFYMRRPATVSVTFARVAGGTELTVAGGTDAPMVTDIVKTIAGTPPAPPVLPRRRAPGTLWLPPEE